MDFYLEYVTYVPTQFNILLSGEPYIENVSVSSGH